MAQIPGVLNQPVVIGTVEYVRGTPLGALVVPFDTPAPDTMLSVAHSRFPVPPVAAAFLTEIDAEMAFGGLSPQGVVYSALSVPGSYLEPTIGQIWPR